MEIKKRMALNGNNKQPNDTEEYLELLPYFVVLLPIAPKQLLFAVKHIRIKQRCVTFGI